MHTNAVSWSWRPTLGCRIFGSDCALYTHFARHGPCGEIGQDLRVNGHRSGNRRAALAAADQILGLRLRPDMLFALVAKAQRKTSRAGLQDAAQVVPAP